LNPRPSDREPSALPLDHGFRPVHTQYYYKIDSIITLSLSHIVKMVCPNCIGAHHQDVSV